MTSDIFSSIMYMIMKKLLAFFFSVAFLFVAVVAVSAQSENANIPERNGDYAVPGRPDVRVRVFVHEPKERPISASAAICSADDPSNAIVGPAGWKLPSSIVNFKVNQSSLPSSLAGMNLATVAATSFGRWTGAITPASSSPTLTYTGSTSKTQKALDFENIITWGRTSGSALGVTYVWYYTATKLVADVDTIMNKKFPWGVACTADSYNAENILVHELGHWFGLNDEYASVFVNNTMFGYGSKAETKKTTLSEGDKIGIDNLY